MILELDSNLESLALSMESLKDFIRLETLGLEDSIHNEILRILKWYP